MNNITITISNTDSSSLANVSLAVTPSAYLALVDSDGSFNVGTIAPNSSAQVSMTIYAGTSAPSPSSLNFVVSLAGPSNTIINSQRVLSFFVSQSASASYVSMSVEPSVLLAGAVNNLTVVVENSGSTAINTLSVQFSFPLSTQLTWLAPQILQAAALAPGQNITTQAQVYESTNSPASTLLQASIIYYDGLGGIHQVNRFVGLLSRGIISMQISSSAVTPINPAPGEIFSITLTLTNTGTTTASAVTATASPSSSFAVFGASSVFIGDMGVGTPTAVTLTFTVSNGTAPGNFSMPIKLAYLDNLRNNITTSISVPVTVAAAGSSGTSSGGTTLRRSGLGVVVDIAILVIVALVMLAVGYLLGKRSIKK